MSNVSERSSFLREETNSPMTGKPMGPLGSVLPSLSTNRLRKSVAKKYAVADIMQAKQTIHCETTAMSPPFTYERFVML
jgi:hypothetical protein